MVILYPYSRNLRKDAVKNLHIYGAQDIFLLFYDDQNTLSSYYDIQMRISQLLFTNKYITKSLLQNYIHTIKKKGEHFQIVLHTYRARANFLLFQDHHETLSTQCEMQMRNFQLIFTNKTYKTLQQKIISILYKKGRG